MKLKSLVASVLLSVCASGAFAENFTQTFELKPSGTSYSGSFGFTHLQAGSFIDTILFNPTNLIGNASSILSTISLNQVGNIDFTKIIFKTANTEKVFDLSKSTQGGGIIELETASLYQYNAVGPFSISVLGSVGAGSGLASSYSGSLTVSNVSPVPEPSTYAMMALGLGLVGFLARRKRHGAQSHSKSYAAPALAI